MIDTMKMLRGSLVYQNQISDLEKAEAILDVIKMATVRHHTYLHDANQDYNKWLGRSGKLRDRAELYGKITQRMTRYYQLHLQKMISKTDDLSLIKIPFDVKKVEQECKSDLKEIAHFFGGWDELRKVIDGLEDNDNEAAYERAMTNY